MLVIAFDELNHIDPSAGEVGAVGDDVTCEPPELTDIHCANSLEYCHVFDTAVKVCLSTGKFGKSIAGIIVFIEVLLARPLRPVL